MLEHTLRSISVFIPYKCVEGTGVELRLVLDKLPGVLKTVKRALYLIKIVSRWWVMCYPTCLSVSVAEGWWCFCHKKTSSNWPIRAGAEISLLSLEARGAVAWKGIITFICFCETIRENDIILNQWSHESISHPSISRPLKLQFVCFS